MVPRISATVVGGGATAFFFGFEHKALQGVLYVYLC